MMDPGERLIWYIAYLEAALRFGAARRDAEDWARSMSLIAEQFVDADDKEPVDA